MINYKFNKLNQNIFYTPEGFTLYLAFNPNITNYQIANNNLNQGMTINKVQSVYVDNSNSETTTIISVQNTGQNIYVPAGAIISWPILISQNDLINFFNFNTSGESNVIVILTDRNLPAIEYSANGSVSGNISITGTLNVNQESSFNGPVSVNAPLYANEGIYTNSVETGTLFNTGTGTFLGMLQANGGLETNSAVMTNGSVSNVLNVLGEITTPKITADIANITSATTNRLNVTSSATIGGNLEVATINGKTPGTATLPSNATFDNLTMTSALINALLNVAGQTNLHGLLTASDGINANTITTTSLATFENLKVISGATIGGNLEVATINGKTPGTATIPSSASFNNLTVNDTLTVSGATNLHGLLTASKGINTNTITTTGLASFTNADVENQLTVNGNQINHGNIQGVYSFTGNNANFTGNVGVAGSLTVGANGLTVNGALNINSLGSIDTTGDIQGNNITGQAMKTQALQAGVFNSNNYIASFFAAQINIGGIASYVTATGNSVTAVSKVFLPVGYFEANVNGTTRKIPYYNP